MKGDFGFFCGLAILIIAISFGCSHCDRQDLENEKLRIERVLPEAKDRAQMVRDLLRSLGKPVAAQTA